MKPAIMMLALNRKLIGVRFTMQWVKRDDKQRADLFCRACHGTMQNSVSINPKHSLTIGCSVFRGISLSPIMLLTSYSTKELADARRPYTVVV